MKQEIQDRYNRLSGIFDAMYDEALPQIELDGVKIKDALKDQLKLQVQWETLVAKLKAFKNDMEIEREEAFASSISTYINHSHRSYSISEAKELAKGDRNYIELRKFEIKVIELYDETNGILETIQSRKYILNNMANLIIASSETVIL